MGMSWKVSRVETAYNSGNTMVMERDGDCALLRTWKDGRNISGKGEYIVAFGFDEYFYSGCLGYESMCYQWDDGYFFDSATDALEFWKNRSEVNMDMENAVRIFNEFYAEMYERPDKHPVGYYEAMGFGEFIMRNAAQFVGEFNMKRGDLLTSDREVAAFGYTVMKVNGLIEGLVWQ